MNSRALILLTVYSLFAQAEEPKKSASDPVQQKYQPELARLKKDYDERIRAVRLRMIADYDSAERTAIAAKNLDQANALRAKIVELRNLMSDEFRIVGKWTITQSNNIKATWTFNKDFTYNYWTDTGQWKSAGGKYFLKHTWDWELIMLDDNTFEGVCTRGDIGVKIRGVRADK